jgi:2-polyprenyl-6-methoxyphenol hydroxylase-like FAD-dependent oxidoreductase
MSDKHRHTTVLIAGGSIAGLTLANALEQLGIDYLVLEKYKEIAPDVGASICIFPNGFRILDQLGCYDRIGELARDADSFASVAIRHREGRDVVSAQGASRQIERR